jgi:hypothetical protein
VRGQRVTIDVPRKMRGHLRLASDRYAMMKGVKASMGDYLEALLLDEDPEALAISREVQFLHRLKPGELTEIMRRRKR